MNNAKNLKMSKADEFTVDVLEHCENSNNEETIKIINKNLKGKEHLATPDLLFARGLANYNLKNYNEALPDMEEGVYNEEEPCTAWLKHNFLASAQIENGQLENAVKSITKAIKGDDLYNYYFDINLEEENGLKSEQGEEIFGTIQLLVNKTLKSPVKNWQNISNIMRKEVKENIKDDVDYFYTRAILDLEIAYKTAQKAKKNELNFNDF